MDYHQIGHRSEGHRQVLLQRSFLRRVTLCQIWRKANPISVSKPTKKTSFLVQTERYLDQGKSLFGVKNYHQALRVFETVLYRIERSDKLSKEQLKIADTECKLDSKLALEAKIWKGITHSRLENYQEAYDILSDAFTKYAKSKRMFLEWSPCVYYEQGIAALALDNPAQAIQHFKHALEHQDLLRINRQYISNEELFGTATWLGRCQYMLQDYATAEDTLKGNLAKISDKPLLLAHAQACLYFVYYDQERYDEAESIFTKINPNISSHMLPLVDQQLWLLEFYRAKRWHKTGELYLARRSFLKIFETNVKLLLDLEQASQLSSQSRTRRDNIKDHLCEVMRYLVWNDHQQCSKPFSGRHLWQFIDRLSKEEAYDSQGQIRCAYHEAILQTKTVYAETLFREWIVNKRNANEENVAEARSSLYSAISKNRSYITSKDILEAAMALLRKIDWETGYKYDLDRNFTSLEPISSTMGPSLEFNAHLGSSSTVEYGQSNTESSITDRANAPCSDTPIPSLAVPELFDGPMQDFAEMMADCLGLGDNATIPRWSFTISGRKEPVFVKDSLIDLGPLPTEVPPAETLNDPQSAVPYMKIYTALRYEAQIQSHQR